MDPISASTYSLCTQTQNAASFTSARSLSKYETKNLKNLLPQIAAACICTLTFISAGISLAYSAVLIPQLESKESDISISKNQTSWLASIISLVAVVSSFCCGFLLDQIGRVKTLKLGVIPVILGWILIATAANFTMIIIGRVLVGFGSAICGSASTVYITEVARKDLRGSLIATGLAFVSLGMVIAYLKGWLLHWRTLAWLSTIYITVPFLLLFLLPESPLWLISKGRTKEALKSLSWLHRYQPQPNDQTKTYSELLLDQLMEEDAQKKAEALRTGGGTFREFLKPTGYKPFLILSGLFFCQQFSGIYIFLFYSVSFFQDVGTDVNPYIASIGIGVIRLIMSLVNTWMLKFVNRRVLIMVSGTGMALCTTISGLFTYWIKTNETELKWVPVIGLLMYVVASMMGLLTIPWTMTAELFPLKIRSLAHSLSQGIANVTMFLAVQNYVNMQEWFGGSAGVQWFFASVSIFTVIYAFIFLPETHGKTLSEIEEYFKTNTIYITSRKKVVLDKIKPESDRFI